MIYLDSTTKKLEVVLTAAVATNQPQISAFYFDQIPAAKDTLTRGNTKVSSANDTTDVTIVDAPEVQGRVRNIQSIQINNKDTATVEITVKIDDGGTETILVKQSVRSGATLQYEDGVGWSSTQTDTTVSGTYTPTLTNVSNIDASTAYTCQYIRVGDSITVSGKFDIDCTSATTTTEMHISLPVASRLSSEEQLGGTAVNTLGVAGRIFADATNDRARLNFQSTTDTSNRNWAFIFNYLVL